LELSFDCGTVLLQGATRNVAARVQAMGMWTWDRRVRGFRCDAIHYPAVRRELSEAFGEALVDGVPRPDRVVWGRIALPTLRREQHDALNAWHDAGGRGQVIMPTGTGKTEVDLAAIRSTSVATLVVAPVRDLMYQWHRRILRGLSCDAGVLGDSRRDVRRVTVTTYDSAYIHMGEIGAHFGLLILDEEHHLPGPCRREAALLSTAPLRLGLTATPERSDGRHADLDSLVGPVVYRQEVPEAKGRTLADFDVVRIPVALADDEQARYDACGHAVRQFIAERQKEQAGYDWKDLCAESGTDPEARRVQKLYYAKKSIEDRAREKLRVLEDLFRLHAGERIVVFAGSNAMALDVSTRFLVPTLLSHSRKRERLAVLEGFAGDRFPVIVANQVLDEGVDVPEAKVAVVIGGQASTRQAKQRLGRILRRTGQARATLYEVVCENTNEVQRSRRRRRSDAYERTRHRRR